MAVRGRPPKSQSAAGSTNVSVEKRVEKIEGATPSNEELMLMIAGLRKELDGLKEKKVKPTVKKEIVVENDEFSELDDFDTIKINQDDYIRVISLTPFELNLSTKSGGKGKVFGFVSFGSVKRIIYSDLVDILEVYQHFLNEGFFYVADRRVIRRHGLDELYDRLLTKEKIESILMGSNSDITVSLFKSANKTQQGIIIQMFIDKMISGQEVDYNLIDKLSRISGINITEKYENTKAYVDSLNENK